MSLRRHPARGILLETSSSYRVLEGQMEIKFRHDVDNVLKEAQQQNKPILLDFSAAPM